jgi:uncharacterized protein (DUF58 family)
VQGKAASLRRSTLLRFSRQHHVVAIRLTSPATESLPNAGWVDWTDPETGRRVLVNTDSSETRQRFRRELARDRADFTAQLGEAAVDLVEVDIGTDPLEALSAFFRRRRLRAS